MGRLTGRIAIVTGGASGIGAASVKLFAEDLKHRDLFLAAEDRRQAGGRHHR